MAGDESFTWNAKYLRWGFLQGAFTWLSLSLIMGLVLAVFLPVGVWWAYYIGGMVVVGGVLGAVLGRREVLTAEFTPQQVRLVSRVSSRTVAVTDLTSVEVAHSGDTEKGYTMTSLQLTWPGGTREIDGDHTPALPSSLAEVLGPSVQVRETWKKLEEPPASA
ncbi:hypothetical protein Pth03_70820 [Planotetraspora thailandica]|uniref:Uncharacterized protein n=1 Tax=Planotetraspora thailandica TaxID=487172 RepID=A0A8J4DDQ6_9ACTN|nr:hypothetical protein [Planotetraspora thailandica]GII58693.1 hypothetical protein Pth03_70820 [Planotetraspora thailandica]